MTLAEFVENNRPVDCPLDKEFVAKAAEALFGPEAVVTTDGDCVIVTVGVDKILPQKGFSRRKIVHKKYKMEFMWVGFELMSIKEGTITYVPYLKSHTTNSELFEELRVKVAGEIFKLYGRQTVELDGEKAKLPVPPWVQSYCQGGSWSTWVASETVIINDETRKEVESFIATLQGFIQEMDKKN